MPTSLGFLSIVTLMLAAVGTYGLIAGATTHRGREFGIRLTTGAAGHPFRLVMGQAVRLAGIALVLGRAGALGLGRALKALIAELDAVDPLTENPGGAP